VKANQADANPICVRAFCRVLGVSASGYYAWRDRPPSARIQANQELTQQIRAAHARSDGTYGMPRVRAELQEAGHTVSRKRVARLMRQACIRGVSRRRGFTVTTERDARQRPAPDLVNREFQATRPNQLWVADITYVPTWQGFVYLAVVLDAFSRKVVGWSMQDRITAGLVVSALNMALHTRKPESVIHHSDQGAQYTSTEFGRRCWQMGVRPSMGTVGDAYDNAMAESFFATLECELLERRSWKTKSEAKAALFAWIEGWYNPRRRHSSIGQLAPTEFERRYEQSKLHIPQTGLPTAALGSSQAPTAAVDNPAPLSS
jgi:putative transposase